MQDAFVAIYGYGDEEPNTSTPLFVVTDRNVVVQMAIKYLEILAEKVRDAGIELTTMVHPEDPNTFINCGVDEDGTPSEDPSEWVTIYPVPFFSVDK